MAALTLGALGAVFGDIGTSLLYAMRETAKATAGTLPGSLAVMAALSLIFWSLIVVVTIKYVVLIMSADNDGEGGVLALASLARLSGGLGSGIKTIIGISAVLGLALFYGDGMLTPAISVLSAVEGLRTESTFFEPFIIPATLVILIGLFAMQSRGTAKIGGLFGPVMVVWFIVLESWDCWRSPPSSLPSWKLGARAARSISKRYAANPYRSTCSSNAPRKRRCEWRGPPS
jgi:KUP system potassium uptake protein